MNHPRFNSRLQEAIAHHLAGRVAQADTLYRGLLPLGPRHFQLLHLAGTTAFQLARHADAAALLTRALREQPRSSPTLMCLALAESAIGHRDLAETHLRASLQADPRNAEAWLNLGALLVLTNRLPDALAAYRRALAVKPDYADAHAGLGSTLLLLGQSDAAVAAHDRALQLAPRHPLAHFCRAQALLASNRLDEARADFDRQLALAPTHLESRSYRLLLLNYLDDFSPEDLFAAHRDYARHLPPAPNLKSQIFNSPASAAPTGRLRVAFLSPDLRTHSVAFFLEPLLRHLDPARFEVVLYHDHFRVDETSRRLQSLAALWRNFVGLSHDAVETQIRADAPHILVDLAGHTGFNRLPLFARRLAPVQLSYLGYPNTSGLTEIDFRFTDAIADPPGSADKLHTEKLIRFAPTAWTWQPPPDAPQLPPASSPAAGARVPVSFGSFNNAAKLSPATLRLWARLLATVPDSRLVLKGSGLDPQRLRPALLAAGFDLDRVDLLPLTASSADHLAAYARIDIALDPFPYNGTTTTCEALWMGRPVITLAGDRHAARVGASLLTAIGRPEWIATSADDYISRAAALASDPATRAAVSAGLRDQLRASQLLDHAAQAARFATALESCWREKSAPAPSRSAPAGDLHHAA